MKNRFIILIPVIIFHILVLICLNRSGLLDRLNLKRNKLKINIVDCKKEDIKNLKIYFVGDDTIPIFINNVLLESSTPDWYGKEHIAIKYNNQKFKHHFQDYKYKSFHKTKYDLEIKKNDDDEILLIWSVKTKWYENNGIDTLYCLSQHGSNCETTFRAQNEAIMKKQLTTNLYHKR